uniref:Uncharacterized protein n=1 Tax=Micrurus corallinus TaxID=54390 RepID=A0A2D4FR94_MICCO
MPTAHGKGLRGTENIWLTLFLIHWGIKKCIVLKIANCKFVCVRTRKKSRVVGFHKTTYSSLQSPPSMLFSNYTVFGVVVEILIKKVLRLIVYEAGCGVGRDREKREPLKMNLAY